MHTNVEGVKNLLTGEEIKIITDECNFIHDIEDRKDFRKCVSRMKSDKIKINKLAAESKLLQDDLGFSGPTWVCPEVTSFYNLFAKAYCISDNIRKGAQNIIV